MRKKIKSYVDTSALIAFLDRSDTYHPLFVQLFADPPPLITSPLVIAEGQGWFLRRYDVTRGLQFLNFVETLSPLKIIPVGSRELHQGTSLLRKFSDEQLTLVDGVGLALMDSEGISVCWSTDRHLSLTGKKLVIYES